MYHKLIHRDFYNNIILTLYFVLSLCFPCGLFTIHVCLFTRAHTELFYTERAHVKNLKVMQKLFCQPMRVDQPAEFVDLLFPNIDEIIAVHGMCRKQYIYQYFSLPLPSRIVNNTVLNNKPEHNSHFSEVMKVGCF